MIDQYPEATTSSPHKGRSRIVSTVLFLVVALIALIAYEWYLRDRAESDWPEFARERSSKLLADASGEFASIQDGVRQLSVEFSLLSEVRRNLSGQETDRITLFRVAEKLSRSRGVGIDIYTRDGEAFAWAGRSGPIDGENLRLALDGRMTSFVTRTPTEAQLSVITPVVSGSGILGAVLIRRLLETYTPFGNRFASETGLTDRLEHRLGVPVEFVFGPGAEPTKDGRFATSFLFGVDSTRVGAVSIMLPSPSDFQDRTAERFEVAQAIIIVLLVILVGAWLWPIICERTGLVAQVVLATLGLWGVRFLLLAMDIPAAQLGDPLFNPMLFASPFGAGIARSMGELAITVCIALVNVAVVVNRLLGGSERGLPNPRKRALGATVLAGIPLAIFLFWGLRGLAAVVQSAVYDSSLEFLNPRSMFPSVELAVMLLTLLALAASYIALCIALSLAAARFGGAGSSSVRSRATIAILGVLFVLAAVLFGTLGRNPLSTLSFRVAFGGVVLLSVFLLLGKTTQAKARALFPYVVVLLAALFIYPLIAGFSSLNDRRRLEAMARDSMKPVDAWFSLVVEDALERFSSNETIQILSSGDESAIGRLAFSHWVASPACREGHTAIFTVFDADGWVKSRFAIGSQLSAALAVDTSMVLDNVREVSVQTVGKGMDALKVYSGLVDLLNAKGELLGFGQVTIAAGQQSLFRGETPLILRAGAGENLQSFYRPVVLAEFHNGMVQPSSPGIFSRSSRLDPSLRQAIERSPGDAHWTQIDIDGSTYETAFLRHPESPDDVLAISVTLPGPAEHLVGFVRVGLHAALLCAVAFVLFSLPVWYRARKQAMSFRTRLLVAMLGMALVPLVVLSWYSSTSTASRLLEESSRTLEDETQAVVASIPNQQLLPGGSASADLEGRVERIAAEVNTDFNLFIRGLLAATSRPELFDLGILDRRLSGNAYASLILRGKEFAVEQEQIGNVEYAVGYRTVADSTGNIAAVVSVPTLFRQGQIEEEAARRNALLFGIYALVLTGVLVVATILTDRLAAPLRQMTAVTRRVASGDLDVEVRIPSADRELGDLIESFGVMTRDLKKNRDDLIRFERELAWKEMAQQVAHEIKNPLTPMKLSVQHLRQAYRDGAENLGEVLDTVSKTLIEQIEALSRIASEFSHFGRMPARRPETLDVNAVVREATQLFEQNKDVRFSYALAEGLPEITADRDELRRAFINLIRNGIQAMDGRGRIDLATALAPGGVQITIRDHGKGIPEEARSKLFQPNFSTKTDGMGLGLAIVKKAIDDLGGTVSLMPAEGKGSVATLVIPVSGNAG